MKDCPNLLLRFTAFLLAIPTLIAFAILILDLAMDKLEEQFRELSTNSS
jgi:hypothetical protein